MNVILFLLSTSKPTSREWRILSNQIKLERGTLENDPFWNFVVNPEKCKDAIFKNLVDSESMSKEMPKSIKPVGTTQE